MRIPHPSSTHLFVAVLTLAASFSTAGCGVGTAAIASSGGTAAATEANTRPQVVGVGISGERVSPAQISFNLVDPEGDSADVEVRFTTNSLFSDSQLIATRTVTGSDGTGTESVIDFDFDSTLGSGLSSNILVFVVLAGENTISLGVNATLTGLGNDAPAMMVDSDTLPNAMQEASGVIPINFEIRDSSSDDVQVQVQFTANPNDPVPTWTDARPAGSGTTPNFAFDPVTALANGTNLVFAWDSDFDLGGEDLLTQVRFVATELSAPGESTPLVDGMTSKFRVDNNEPPALAMDVVGFALNPDESRSIAVPYEINDPEGDTVDVLFQWRTQGEAFPTLPTDVDSLKRLLIDPEQRRALQIATEAPRTFEGTVRGNPASNRIRLPELGTTAAILSSRKANDPVGSLRDLELQLLRPTSLAFLSEIWATNHLVGPAGIVMRDAGKGYVLDSPSFGLWQVRELDLATGNVGAAIGSTQFGFPQAICAIPDSASLLVATLRLGSWVISKVDPLQGGVITDVFSVAPGLPNGAVRAIEARRGDRCFVTVSDSLIEVSFREGEQASGREVLNSGVLKQPSGIVMDPDDDEVLFIAETGLDRIVRLNLKSLTLSPVRTTLSGIPNPTALAFEEGRRLLILSDINPLDGVKRLFTAKLGINEGGFSSTLDIAQLDIVSAAVDSIATGEIGTRVALSSSTSGVLVAGGIDQVRTVIDYDPAEFEVTVDQPFLSFVQSGRPWRLVDRQRSLSSGGTGKFVHTFLWDSNDVPGTIEVELRGIAFDRDVGILSGTSPKSLRSALDSTVVTAFDAPPLFSGDVDGDGDADFVTANSLFTQFSPGSFSQTPLPISSPEFVADVDGDGLLDLLKSGNVHRLAQGSPPTFASPTSTGATAPVSDVGDVNRDGRMDLMLVTGEIRYQVSTLTFSSGPGVSQATTPILDPLLRDSDGDGDLDVSFGNGVIGNSEFLIAIQDSNGNFSSTEFSFLNISFGAFRYAASDLDLDGKADFVVANPFDDFFFVNGNVSTDFSDGSIVTIAPPGGADGSTGIVLADIDGNGLRDLVTEHSDESSTSVFYQTAPGQLRRQGAPINTLSGTPRLAVDIDGDGIMDLTGGALASSTGRLLYSRTPGTIDGTSSQAVGAAMTGFAGAALGDFDGDGDLDIVGTEPLIGIIHLVDQVRPGLFSAQAQQIFPGGGEVLPEQVIAAEINGDGITDFLANLGSGSSSSSGVFASTGADFFGGGPIGARELSVVDLDGTGTLEVMRVTNLDILEIWRLTPSSFGSNFELLSLPVESNIRMARVGDIDSNNLGDIVFTTTSGDVRVMKQTALDSYATSTLIPGGGDIVLIDDLDRDGRMDLVTKSGGLTRFHYQNTVGAFELSSNTLSRGVSRVVHIDNDGAPDLLLDGGSDVAIQILPRVFVENTRLSNGSGGFSDLGDIDGDGELDGIRTAGNSITTHFGGR